VRAGKADADELARDKRARSGFPTVNRMQEEARFGKGLAVAAAIAALGADFVALWPEADAELIAEWEFEHRRRGWPWLPEFRADKPLFLPPGAPEAGLAWFETALRGMRGNDADAAQRHAAE
jgi:hypothetical protein